MKTKDVLIIIEEKGNYAFSYGQSRSNYKWRETEKEAINDKIQWLMINSKKTDKYYDLTKEDKRFLGKRNL